MKKQLSTFGQDPKVKTLSISKSLKLVGKGKDEEETQEGKLNWGLALTIC